ncbi:DUF2510 domain-containing protein [Mycobacterium sp. NPDC049093]
MRRSRIIDNSIPPAGPPGWFDDPWKPRQRRYFDGQQWSPHTAPAPVPPPDYAGDTGYPFGEQVLVLRTIATEYDASITCGVENVRGEQIGLIQPRARIPWTTRATADLHFVMARPDGTPLLYLTRYGGYSGHVIQVNDATGHDFGCLRQAGSRWRVLRLTMALEFNGQRLGQSNIATSVLQMNKKVSEPIYGAADAVLGHVERRWLPNFGSRNPHYDYTLDCSAPTPHPLPALMLATAFAHYMYDRIQMGGPLGAGGRTGRKQTTKRQTTTR